MTKELNIFAFKLNSMKNKNGSSYFQNMYVEMKNGHEKYTIEIGGFDEHDILRYIMGMGYLTNRCFNNPFPHEIILSNKHFTDKIYISTNPRDRKTEIYKKSKKGGKNGKIHTNIFSFERLSKLLLQYH